MKQVCFWPSPFVLTVVMALVATIVSPCYDFVRFQTKWASTPPSHIKPITFGNELWTYDVTNCPAQRCLGIRAPLNFVSSLLWLCSSLPFPNRSLNPQITSLRNFVLLWTAVGLKKKGCFRMVRHIPPGYSSRPPGYFLSWGQGCPSVSPDLLLAVQTRASSRLRAVCATLSTRVGDRRLRFAGGPPSKLLSL